MRTCNAFTSASDPAACWAGAHLVRRAEQGLDVMPDLVRDYVRLGEISLRGELGLELPEEGEIDVQHVVGGAVERTRGGSGRAAAGIDAVGEHP
jgi:hypothetical protein